MTKEGLGDLLCGPRGISAEGFSDGCHFVALAADGAVEGGEVGDEEGHEALRGCGSLALVIASSLRGWEGNSGKPVRVCFVVVPVELGAEAAGWNEEGHPFVVMPLAVTGVVAGGEQGILHQLLNRWGGGHWRYAVGSPPCSDNRLAQRNCQVVAREEGAGIPMGRMPCPYSP